MEQSAGRVKVASTGKRPEKEKIVPVRRGGEAAKVVMWLGQSGKAPLRLPDLAPGDGLEISAEVEVTTDCKQKQSDCVKEPYQYAPEVEVRLVVADSEHGADTKPGHARVIDKQRRKVTHDRHHDVFVFDDVPFEVPAEGMPWSGETFINVAVGATHNDARDDHVVLIGQNDEGDVKGDMSQISVIRSRPAKVPRPEVIREDRRRAEAIPVIKGERRVVYAQELKDLGAGEQLVVKADVVTSAEHLDYPARATIEVLLAEDPSRSEPGAEAKRVTATDARICIRNGKNCLKAESPMTSHKSGVLRVERNAKKPLHVIVVLTTGDPLQKAKAGDELRIRENGSLRIFRFPAEMADGDDNAGGEG